MVHLRTKEKLILVDALGRLAGSLAVAVRQFCPTGQGGGVDPSCGTGGGGHSSGGMAETKRGKDGKLTLANGDPLPAHIPKNIPPAWKNVSINPDPSASMLVKGTDSKGREIRMYSDDHKVHQAAEKFARTSELLAKHEAIKKQIHADLNHSDPNVREPAHVMALIAETGIRPGSERDTGADKQAYGATTLQARHVRVSPKGNVSLKFVGKKGVDLNIPIEHPEVAKMLVDRKKSAEKGTSKLFATNDHALRDYAHGLDGGKFKPKDFRTAVGTGTAAKLVSKMKKPTTEKEYKKAVKAVAKEVSDRLGNTPTIALQSYIDPSVFSGWRLK